ncbi:hypothetical protein BD779DRAFT_1527374 [Infundibulicybe gibba]|nr:hypothetical protein BD779DRAFT_1527374 [Infundibulicybe gibba]
MEPPSSSNAHLKSEIARLTATINQRKSLLANPPQKRSNTYINPNYKPPSRPQSSASNRSQSQNQVVVLNGVEFSSSSRSLVRKDLPKPTATTTPTPQTSAPPAPAYTRKFAHRPTRGHPYKPIRKPTRGRGRGRGRPVNMTLDNTKRVYAFVFNFPFRSTLHPRSRKKVKYSDKPCPRFTTTGACTRGLTCPYTHDPSQIAICWNFLHGKCPYPAARCALSHDPTPERTPVCVHFAAGGRCTRTACPFPHVRLGAREGVCRAFAVLGYCARGLDCPSEHVRECPDFAEGGGCKDPKCRLPHVIRANRDRARRVDAEAADAPVMVPEVAPVVGPTAEDAQLGDEYISLTFNEESSEEEASDEEGDEEGSGDEEEMEQDEGDFEMERE